MSLKRFALSCAAVLIAGQPQAAVVDLVAHNGFEACWSQAITKATFLQLVQDSVNDRSFCIGKSSGSGPGVTYEACNTNACAGNTVGCPVTTHAGVFGGDFVTGSFSATGTADTVTVPITYTAIGTSNCTITISNIALDYAPAWFATPDGNSGSYMAYLSQSAVSLAAEPDVSVAPPGDFVCNALLSLLQSTIIAQAESTASDGWATQLAPDTEHESVCPLAP
jgi:hypothetical protein